MEIRLLDVAQQELDEAVEFYNHKSPGLGDQFLLEARCSRGLHRTLILR